MKDTSKNEERSRNDRSTAPSLESAAMLRIAGLERVHGRSLSPSSWRKGKSLAEARNLFTGPQLVIHGRLRAFAPGSVSPHFAHVLAYRASLLRPLLLGANVGRNKIGQNLKPGR
jgi:hypothetical protein